MSASEPSWSLYETFLTVMRGGSLSAAARSLNVAQPTIRRRIEALEQELAVVLFTRATNGLVPTEAALRTLPAAEAMAAAARSFGRMASAPLGEDRGTVRVSASVVMGALVLPGMLTPLLAAHPGLQVEIATSNRTVDLLRRDADLAVRMVAPTQSALVARRVGRVPVGLFAHPRYLRDRAPVRSLEDLRAHALVGADQERGLLHALAALGLTLTPRDFALRSDDDVAQLSAVRAGLGIGGCQAPLAAREGLVPVLPSLRVPLEVWVVMHEDLRRVRRVRSVFDHLVTSLQAYITEAPDAPVRRRGAR